MDALVSTEWLERELGASDLRIVDATKFMAGTERDARAEYEAGHIRSEEHTSELPSLMRNSYAVFCLTKTYKVNKSELIPITRHSYDYQYVDKYHTIKKA